MDIQRPASVARQKKIRRIIYAVVGVVVIGVVSVVLAGLEPAAPAVTQGRVERILIRPGVEVTPDTVILELSEPTVQQALSDAEQALRGAEADYSSLQARLDSDRLNQRSAAAVVAADFKAAQLQKEVD